MEVIRLEGTPSPREYQERWGVTDDCAQCSYPPEGWFALVDRLMLGLKAIPGWDPHYVLQIKSKFGGLRFYYALPKKADESLKANVEALLAQFEEEAYATCSACSSTDGWVKTAPDETGWIRTACRACHTKR
jgi:hypothetical protein